MQILKLLVLVAIVIGSRSTRAENASLAFCQKFFMSVPEGACADGRCLVQSSYGYAENDFPLKMAKAIDQVSLAISRASASNVKVSVDEISSLMEPIALTRAAVAKEHGAPEASKYGLKLPNDATQMKSFLSAFLPNSNFAFEEFRISDVIGDPFNPELGTLAFENPIVPFYEGARHRHFFEQAYKLAAKQQSAPPVFNINGEAVSLSKLRIESRKTEKGEVARFVIIEHPSLENMAKLRRRAYSLLSQVVSKNKNSLLEADLHKIAQAQFLLMHATPYYRGSPAIVESFIDAVLRAKYKKALGAKQGEPFWDVMLWQKDPAQYGAKDFFKNFQPQ